MLNSGQDKRISIYQTYFVFETHLNKATYIIYEKLSRVFNVAGFRFEEKIKPSIPVLLTVYFSAALKALVFGNLFKVFRLDITFAR